MRLFVSSCASLVPSDTQTWAVESVTLFGLEKYQILATYLRSCRMSMSPRFVTYVVVRNFHPSSWVRWLKTDPQLVLLREIHLTVTNTLKQSCPVGDRFHEIPSNTNQTISRLHVQNLARPDNLRHR